MAGYLDPECEGCPEYIRPYGCTNHGCSIYIDYELGRAEMAADFEHDKRKEELIEQNN